MIFEFLNSAIVMPLLLCEKQEINEALGLFSL